MEKAYAELAGIGSGERVLLLAHCLRPSQTCPGRQSRMGLVCPEGCRENCVAGRLRRAALALGYKGVCIAAGGSMALRFVAEHRPRAIVAVACVKELQAGEAAVRETPRPGQEQLVVVPVALSRDGCVDTEVDETQALRAIAVGCG